MLSSALFRTALRAPIENIVGADVYAVTAHQHAIGRHRGTG
jgi:hypothetical protein